MKCVGGRDIGRLIPMEREEGGRGGKKDRYRGDGAHRQTGREEEIHERRVM